MIDYETMKWIVFDEYRTATESRIRAELDKNAARTYFASGREDMALSIIIRMGLTLDDYNEWMKERRPAE